ncbi:DNA adenine methylase [Paenibacillus sanguinis]|uniref:DNA adenine methylase n=1 Tax=Paenibacillus sanguinis TaxID=225906 RepID=UPI00035D650D|nr:Dam family site-specific DNA-(adenine-N6)-methyltransferase [Paenibacillus sanguinis]
MTLLLEKESKATVNESIKKKNNYQVKCMPMLKWAGGKRRILKHLLPIIPKNYKKYYEPFFGGGALFFATQPQNAILSDTNQELIECYQFVKDSPQEVIDKLRYMENSKDNYFKVRNNLPENGLERAARIIFLTTLSFNGLYRLNLKGEFNVPYGNKVHINPCDDARIIAVSKALRNAELDCCDFSQSVDGAGKNDFVYFDPPYAISQGNGFVKYNSKVFTWNDQVRLANEATKLVDKGCKVIVSNANVPEIRELYRGFNCKILERPSVIAASGEHRKKITECIFYNGGENNV